MTTKEKLLTLFEKNKGVYFSGRGKEGYKIHAAQNKGYCLAADTDILSVQGIQKYLESSCSQIKLTVLPAAASTNALLRAKTAWPPRFSTVLWRCASLWRTAPIYRNTGNAVSLSGGKSLSFFRKEQKKLLPWMSMGNAG